MKKIIALCGLLILSGSVLAKKNLTREGTWNLNYHNQLHFIEMDLFDQQILTVNVSKYLPNGKPASAINMRCDGKNYHINPGEKAVCRTLWSYEVVTLSMNDQNDKDGESAGNYKLIYIS